MVPSYFCPMKCYENVEIFYKTLSYLTSISKLSSIEKNMNNSYFNFLGFETSGKVALSACSLSCFNCKDFFFNMLKHSISHLGQELLPSNVLFFDSDETCLI